VQRRVTHDYIPDNLAWIRSRIGRSTAHQAEGLSPDAALHARRNFRLGVLNGMMFSLVDALIAPTFVLALFVNRLGGPNVLVGLIPAIYTGGGLLPQILVAGRVQGRKQLMHWYRRTALVRTLCVMALAALTALLAGYPALLLVVFFILYSGYAFGAGISSLPWFEIIAKVISPRRRGTFFSLRNFWGGVLALVASGLISAILSEKLTGLVFPYNFALLFGITSLVIAIGFAAMSSVKEPDATETAPPMSLKVAFQRGIEAVRTDRDYRAFMIARVLLGLVTIADPFYVVYAKTALGAPVETVGLYLGATAASSLFSNFIWGPLADRAGNRTLMILSVLSVASVPLAALLVPMFSGLISRADLNALFAVVFLLGGLATGSARIVSANMMLSIAPPASRATYLGFLSTVLGLVTFVSVLGGLVVDTLGFTVLFLIALVVAALALLASMRMSTKPSY
jgi:MFS family permease